MCAIIGWAGQLPVGLLTSLLLRAQSRGRDGTGVAYWNGTTSRFFKLAVHAGHFTQDNAPALKTARLEGLWGLGHTRNASPDTPIDDDAAHPFVEQDIVYCHNGRITNARAIDPDVRVDSEVLGDCCLSRDFSTVDGTMAVAWISKDGFYFYRVGKEIEACTATLKDGSKLGLVGSTEPILRDALDRASIKADLSFYTIEQGVLYQLTKDVVLTHGPIPTNAANRSAVDKWSSSEVKP